MNYLIALLTAVTLAACGTNTGNPVVDNSAPAYEVIPIANQLAGKICAKVQECHASSSFTACHDAVASSPGYTSELGTNASAYSTLRELETAERSGAVMVVIIEGDTCESAIEALACNDPIVTGAYSAGTATDYSATNQLFRASPACQNIY